MNATNELSTCRRTVFTLLILASAAMMTSRILAIEKDSLGANDISRWCTIRALVDNGTYVIGRRQYSSDGTFRDSGITTEDGWGTIDKFLHPEQQAFYSEKPPLFPTVAALVYWLLKHTLGWSITHNRLAVIRCTLLVVNCLPLTIYLCLLGRLLEQFGRTDWGRLFLMAAACLGTYLTTFATVLNNHTIAACFVLFALYQAFPCGPQPHAPIRSWLRFGFAGFFASCAAAVDLPAAAFLAWIGVILFRRSPRFALCFFTPGAALPFAAFLLTNFMAVGQLRPAYMEFGGPWFTYEGSYWKAGAPYGIDAAGEKETKLEYALHLLYGHHGLLSLTPVFLLGLLGLLEGRAANKSGGGSNPTVSGMETPADQAAQQDVLWILSSGAWLLAAVVLGFYVYKTSCYGGLTAGPRYLFWLTPLLLLSAVPMADLWSKRRTTRWIGYSLLAVSIFSANFSASRPWTHPWLYQLMSWQGWLPY